MAADLSTVLGTLPQLTSGDLQAVAGKVKALLSLSGTTVPGQTERSPTQDYILEGIHFELRRRGVLGQASRLPQHSFPSGYVNASHKVRRDFEEYLPNLKAIERTAAGQLMARCLADWLEIRGIQVRPKIMLSNVNNILDAIDYAYPGYLRAGLLQFCWKQR